MRTMVMGEYAASVFQNAFAEALKRRAERMREQRGSRMFSDPDLAEGRAGTARPTQAAAQAPRMINDQYRVVEE